MNQDHGAASHNGFRLANELEGILTGIRADGVIHPLEQERVERWLESNEPFAHLQPFSALRMRLQLALSDGRLSMDECDDLLFVTQKLTTVNPYFDAMRSGLQVLFGVLTGVVSDGRTRPSEVDALVAWTDEWGHLQGLWPFDEAMAVVVSIQTGRMTREQGHQLLLNLSQQFPLGGSQADLLAPLLIQGVCAVDPQIVFPDRVFVFTGASSKKPRSHMEALVTDRGGRALENVNRKANYLVVCDEGNPCWAFACYGRKVEQACLLRRDGHPITIVHEADFWDAVA